MVASLLRSHPWRVVALGAVLAVVVVALAIALSGDDPPPAAEPDPEPVAEPDPEPEPEPEPEPDPDPVVGEVEVAEPIDVSIHGHEVYASGQPEDEPLPLDDDAVAAFTAAVAGWLDAHLDDLQHGGDGLVPDGALAGNEAALRLADADHLVVHARYGFTVYVRGEPEWLLADVEVERDDGSRRSAEVAFLPGDDEVTVLAAGVIDADGSDATEEER